MTEIEDWKEHASEGQDAQDAGWGTWQRRKCGARNDLTNPPDAESVLLLRKYDNQEILIHEPCIRPRASPVASTPIAH